MEDGLRTSIETCCDEFMAELEDLGLYLSAGLMRTGVGSPRARL